jgi:hypothetical protein
MHIQPRQTDSIAPLSCERPQPPTPLPTANLKLALQQVPTHLPSRDPRHAPQSWEVEGARQTIAETEEHHGRDPAARVLEREAAVGHLVLLDGAAAQVVHAARVVDLGLVLAGDVGELCAGKDVEVIVGCVAAGVALCADRGSWFTWLDVTEDRGRGEGSLPKMIRYSVTLAWMMYMAPMAPPALLKIHSSSWLMWFLVPGSSLSSSTMYLTMALVSSPWAAMPRFARSWR